MNTVPKKYLKYTLEDKLEAIRLYESGVVVTEIGRKLQINVSTVQSWLRLYKAYGTLGLEGRRHKHLTGKEKIRVIRDGINNN